MYFCTWCARKGWTRRPLEDFAVLENGWRDSVCLLCREEERLYGTTMADKMAQ